MASDFFTDDFSIVDDPEPDAGAPADASEPQPGHGEAADPAPADVAPAAEPPAQPTVFSRRIDLGDGSGVQVFEADTADGLLDKLAEAQRHATGKIRELTAELRGRGAAPAATPAPAAAAAARALTAEEKFVLAEEMKSDPEAAVDKLLRLKTGMTVAEFGRAVADAKRAAGTIEERQQAEAFVAAHPEYHVSARNGAAMDMYMRANQLPPTRQNFEAAFAALTSSGLLESAAKPAQEPERIAPRTPPKPSRSGLSPRSGRGAERQDQGELTAEEAERLPLDELRQRIAEQFERASA